MSKASLLGAWLMGMKFTPARMLANFEDQLYLISKRSHANRQIKLRYFPSEFQACGDEITCSVDNNR
jgi:hypothetical protein